MGCCRGNRKALVENKQKGPCLEIERKGASLTVGLIYHEAAYRLVANIEQKNVDILWVINHNGCTGSMSKTIKRYAERILEAARIDPVAFQNHRMQGSTLVKLLKISDEVLKNGKGKNSFNTSR